MDQVWGHPHGRGVWEGLSDVPRPGLTPGARPAALGKPRSAAQPAKCWHHAPAGASAKDADSEQERPLREGRAAGLPCRIVQFLAPVTASQDRVGGSESRSGSHSTIHESACGAELCHATTSRSCERRACMASMPGNAVSRGADQPPNAFPQPLPPPARRLHAHPLPQRRSHPGVGSRGSGPPPQTPWWCPHPLLSLSSPTFDGHVPLTFPFLPKRLSLRH